MKLMIVPTVRFPLTAATFAAIALALVQTAAGAHAGRDALGLRETMGLAADANLPYSCQFVKATATGNVLWPGEQAQFTFQLVNNSNKPIRCQGKVDVIPYGCTGDPGDMWAKKIFKTGATSSTRIEVDIAADKFQNVTVKPDVPERLGGYGMVVDLGPSGRSFVTSFVRTFQPSPTAVHYPQITSDVTDVAVLSRLGVCPNRMNFGYRPTTDPGFDKYFADHCAQLEAYKKAGLPITIEFGAASAKQCEPLGRPRPHLDENGVMISGRADMAWMPSFDPDFKKLVKRVLEKYGWPRGPVIAVKFMNEPFDGSSISGWGADIPRYREIFRALCEARDEARKEYGIEVLTGGCDSSSTTFDKFFADGKDDFLKYLDFCSIHYQGLNPPSTYKPWLARTGPSGRVRIWDTESWVANSDDKVVAVLAAFLSAGYEHVVGVNHSAVCSRNAKAKIIGDDGRKIAALGVDTWSTAAALATVEHFIGQRTFKEMLFKNGLPWVMVFDGDPDAGAFSRPIPRTARSWSSATWGPSSAATVSSSAMPGVCSRPPTPARLP